MNTLKQISLCAILGLSLLQAADSTHGDKTNKESEEVILTTLDMFNLSVFYMQKIELLRRVAAENTRLDDLFTQGLLYDELGCRGQAEQLWRVAAKGGHLGALFNLGMLSDDKKQRWANINQGGFDLAVYCGIEWERLEDKNRAAECWKYSAYNGNLHAILSLMELYEKEAEKFMKAAAENGHVNARLYLERMQQLQ